MQINNFTFLTNVYLWTSAENLQINLAFLMILIWVIYMLQFSKFKVFGIFKI